MSNISDVTNSPADWQDFWNNEDEESIIQQLMQPREEFKTSNYIEDVITGAPVARRYKSPLSD
jgi:hypothetical protein|tara:strand:+ start:393 stop:581 length:189 start_codon:yes stop_codon:yes gene_type:complete